MSVNYPLFRLLSALLLLPFACAQRSFGTTRVSAASVIGASNLRQIGQVSLIYARDNRDRLPQATDIWDYAKLLSSGGGLEDARLWQLPMDPANRATFGKESLVLLPAKVGHPRELNPEFLKIKPSYAVPIGPKMSTGQPSTTPIAWTRGLQPDGTWAPHSPYGSAGGHIVFLGGNVAFFKNLGGPNSGELVRFDGKGSTNNILEALPPGTRISEYIPTPDEQRAWASPSRIETSSRFMDNIDAGVVALLALIWIPVIYICIDKIDRGTPGSATLITFAFFISLLLLGVIIPIA